MAEFLVECLLADELLLEQCDRKEPMALQQYGPTSSDPIHRALEESLDRHHQLNRESMRRTRRRTRCGIEVMRQTLATLSQEFYVLCERKRDTQRSLDLVQLEDAYATLAETSHRLKAEKFHIERLLMENDKTRLRIADTMSGLTGNAKAWEEPAAQYFGYVDVTKTHAQAAISTAYRCVMELEKAARPLADWIGSVGNPTRTFGWSVKCEISSSHNFFLSMTKRLEGVKAQDAINSSWALITRDRRPAIRMHAATAVDSAFRCAARPGRRHAGHGL